MVLLTHPQDQDLLLSALRHLIARWPILVAATAQAQQPLLAWLSRIRAALVAANRRVALLVLLPNICLTLSEMDLSRLSIQIADRWVPLTMLKRTSQSDTLLHHQARWAVVEDQLVHQQRGLLALTQTTTTRLQTILHLVALSTESSTIKTLTQHQVNPRVFTERTLEFTIILMVWMAPWLELTQLQTKTDWVSILQWEGTLLPSLDGRLAVPAALLLTKMLILAVDPIKNLTIHILTVDQVAALVQPIQMCILDPPSISQVTIELEQKKLLLHISPTTTLCRPHKIDLVYIQIFCHANTNAIN